MENLIAFCGRLKLTGFTMSNGRSSTVSSEEIEQYEIPEGLNDLLYEFAVNVLISRPSNLHDFAADYFNKLRDEKKVKTIPMYIIVDDDDDSGEPEQIRYVNSVIVCQVVVTYLYLS